jgi:Uma2 family endonuclease
MQDVPARQATYDDLKAVPPHLVAEIIRGRLVTHPRPMPRHVRSTSRLGIVLGAPFDIDIGGPGGWWILDEPELHLGPDVVVPDVAGWRLERMPELPESAWFEIVPNWVCETISRSTETYDRGEKRDIYGENGVRHLWLLDPVAKLLETYELTGGKWLLLRTYREGDTASAPPFDSVPFAADLLWPGRS